MMSMYVCACSHMHTGAQLPAEVREHMGPSAVVGTDDLTWPEVSAGNQIQPPWRSSVCHLLCHHLSSPTLNLIMEKQNPKYPNNNKIHGTTEGNVFPKQELGWWNYLC